MPPDRGRASKACVTCRKIKTRCYESDAIGRPCLRCERLRQTCSLEVVSLEDRQDLGASHRQEGEGSHDERISRLEQTVSALVEKLGERPGRWVPHPDVSSTSPTNPPPINEVTPEVPSAAPVFLIRDVASHVGVQQQQSAPAPPRGLRHLDIINQGLISLDDAIILIKLFQEHYGRWVSYSETVSPDALLADIRESPLLLCACCLIAVRHMSWISTAELAPRLFQEAKSLLSTTLLDIPQSISFFQAAVILSMWSTTIGQSPLSIDNWLLSGFALQHSLASNIFASISSGSRPASLSRNELDRRCIWNHLSLAHLHYCVGTRRKAMFDIHQINKCREVLVADQITNFETRMVAEINLYWIIYESCAAIQVDLPGTQTSLHQWREEWKFLFATLAIHPDGLPFAQLLVYDRALKSRSAAVRESLLSEMIRLSAAIIQLALDTTDVRTRHLSDHIYHMITFAAVTLCRLLHMYGAQLTASHNIVELDSLVLTLVTWLHSIGLPCHVAQTLGDVVAAFHKELRPNAHPSPYAQAQDDIELYFPELLGIEMYADGNFDFNPDWEPYIQGPAT
ncbi:hypothetical protein BDZ45DRAFT_805164 [Acephala macrosclerotiorum]|nr:hypothetical protein BDZ45DRAFT_805164 [Acephala macrosclerotiorum]